MFIIIIRMDKEKTHKSLKCRMPLLQDSSEIETEYDDEMTARLPSTDRLLVKVNIVIYGAIALFILLSFMIFG
jgi:hypothetical protein